MLLARAFNVDGGSPTLVFGPLPIGNYVARLELTAGNGTAAGADLDIDSYGWRSTETDTTDNLADAQFQIYVNEARDTHLSLPVNDTVRLGKRFLAISLSTDAVGASIDGVVTLWIYRQEFNN